MANYSEEDIIKRGIMVRKYNEAIDKAIKNLCHNEAIIIEKEIQKLIDTSGDK